RSKDQPAQPPDPIRRSGAGNPTSTSTDHTRKDVRSPATPAGHAELHSHLTRRITELQRERQSYWRKILSAINK
ncbi:MAG: hypothetical protein WBX00_29250, partial [Isosphaeraceae bacterium]